MKQFEDLNYEEQFEMYNNAFTWKHDHADRVETILVGVKDKVAPSGSSMFHPELWKGVHWKWFMDELSNIIHENLRTFNER